MSSDNALDWLDAEFELDNQVEALNAMELAQPGFKDRLGMSAFIAEEQGMDVESVFQNYEQVSVATGRSADPSADRGLEQSRMLAIRKIEDPGFLQSVYNASYRGGVRIPQTVDGLDVVSAQGSINRFESQIAERNIKISSLPEGSGLRSYLEGRNIDAQKQLQRQREILEENVLDYTRRQMKIVSIPMSSRMQEFRSEEGSALGIFNPATFAELMAEEIVASAPSLAIVLGSTAVGGPVAGGATSGVLEYSRSYSSSFFDYMSKSGIDTTNSEQALEWLKSKENYAKADEYATKKAGVIGVASGLSVGLADKGNAIAQSLLIQPGAAGLGEAASSWIVGENADIKNILVEIAAEVPGGALEVGAARIDSVSSSLMGMTDKFRNLISSKAGTPARVEDIQAMSEANPSGIKDGLSDIESVAIDKIAEGKDGAQDLIDRLYVSKQHADDSGIYEFRPRETADVSTFEAELLQLTEGIRSAESEIESNLDVSEDIGDVPVRPGDPRDPTLEDRLAEKDAKEQAKLDREQREIEREIQAELDEINDMLELSMSTPPSKEDIQPSPLTDAEDRTVSKILNSISGQGNKLTPKQLAVAKERVRGDKRVASAVERGLNKLKAANERRLSDIAKEREKADRRVFEQKERIANLQEKLAGQKTEAKFKLQQALKKKDEFYKKRIEDIRQRGHDKVREKQLMAQEIRDSIRDTERLIRSMPADFRSKFPNLGRMADAKTVEALMKTEERIKDKIEQIYVDETRKVLVGKVRKVDKQYQKELSAAKKGNNPLKHGEELGRYLDLSRESEARSTAQSKYNDLIDRVIQAEETGVPYRFTEQDIITQQEALVPDLTEVGDQDIDLIEEYLDNLNSIKSDGLTNFRREQLKKKKLQESDRNVVTDLIRKHRPQYASGKSKRKTAIGKFINDVRFSMLRDWAVDDLLTGATNDRLHEVHHEAIKNSAGERARLNLESDAALRSDMERFKIDIATTKNTSAGVVGGKPVALSEAMFWYANSQNADNKRTLNNTKWGSAQLVDRAIQPIIDAIPQNYKDFVDAQIDKLSDEGWRQLNEGFFRPKYGVDMPKVDRYFPMMAIDGGTSFDAVTHDFVSRQAKTGAVRSRQKHSRGFKEDRMDFFTTLVSHKHEVNHAIAFADTMDRINSLFGDETVQKEIERTQPGLVSYLKDLSEKIATGKITNDGHWLNTMSEWLRKRSSVVQIGFNIFSAAKAFASAPVALNQVKPGFALEAATNFSSNPVGTFEEAKALSPYMNERLNESTIREQNELRARAAIERSIGDMSWWKKIQDSSFAPIVAVDRMISTVTWHAKYNEVMNQPDGTIEEAVRQADQAVIRSQQAGTLETLPPAFTNGGLARLWTQYLVDVNLVYNQIESQLAVNPRSAKDWASIGAFSIIAPSLILALVNYGREEIYEEMGLRDESDEDDVQELLVDVAASSIGQVSGTFPLLNRVIDSNSRRLMGDDKGAWFAGSLEPPAWAALNQAARVDLTDPDAKTLSLLGSYILGVPAGGTISSILLNDSKKDSMRDFGKL